MKIQILWVPPAERRFGSGDILTLAELAAFGVDAQTLLDAGEAQMIEPEPKPARAAKRGGGGRA